MKRWHWFAIALGLRVALIYGGAWYDSAFAADVKYTDIDYFVFSDAAALVERGQSPYERATYRTCLRSLHPANSSN